MFSNNSNFNFRWSPQEEFMPDRGSGRIGTKRETSLMLWEYSCSSLGSPFVWETDLFMWRLDASCIHWIWWCSSCVYWTTSHSAKHSGLILWWLQRWSVIIGLFRRLKITYFTRLRYFWVSSSRYRTTKKVVNVIILNSRPNA